MTEMFGEAWSPMSVPDLAPDDDDVMPCIIIKTYTFLIISPWFSILLKLCPVIATVTVPI